MPIPRCQVIPLPDHQASFQIAGVERLRWHYGDSYPRPFFYPFVGPSGQSLTRMGHPGAPDHDHHRSIWFAHHKVLGIDFWSDQSPARVRQKQWLCYHDSADAAGIAVLLGWYDGHDPKELMEQEMIAWLSPHANGELLLELQSSFRPTAATLELGKTNFGFLAVRVAKAISAHFGGGTITGSDGQTGEPALFGKPSKWVDYSGSIAANTVEGITYFDHAANPGYPAHWHVREDGWMNAGASLTNSIIVERSKPLVLRYLLYAHRGAIDTKRADSISRTFAESQVLQLSKSKMKHTQYEIVRKAK
jgi:hypothetical protein